MSTAPPAGSSAMLYFIIYYLKGAGATSRSPRDEPPRPRGGPHASRRRCRSAITTLVRRALFARLPKSSRRRAIFSRTWATTAERGRLARSPLTQPS
ncbi:hypothetical protein MSG28_009745 [Choristoneura fumiferana]|uniref:Uncharacterized protein n=1 Tax=Choristoneura fumiferana TaxID=7141 RepID=A0ACC0JCN4_CHOFU|nr:hypothetical protein MSG28_009745 [Choristoneura fumiferana]